MDKMVMLIRFARVFASLGDCIGEQLRDFVESNGEELPTPGAISYIDGRLLRPLRELAQEFNDDEFYEEYDELVAALSREDAEEAG